MAPRTKIEDRKFILLDNGQTPTYAEDVTRRINQGESIDMIARHLQVSDSTLRTWLRRNGYSPVRQPVLWSSDELRPEPVGE